VKRGCFPVSAKTGELSSLGVITENSVHAQPASLGGCGFPSAGYRRDGAGDAQQDSWELRFVRRSLVNLVRARSRCWRFHRRCLSRVIP
jgi:hypothetical protein